MAEAGDDPRATSMIRPERTLYYAAKSGHVDTVRTILESNTAVDLNWCSLSEVSFESATVVTSMTVHVISRCFLCHRLETLPSLLQHSAVLSRSSACF